jgi:NADPH-dependent 2,4-dienoyl-CoA reductase/sulfur reductase-like enzyme
MPDLSCEVLVVGGGPAGIAAAVHAAGTGADTVLIDENPRPGGQIWRGASAHAHDGAGRWLRRLAASGARTLVGAVVGRPAPGTVQLERDGGPLLIGYRHAVLCPGARERFRPFPGWTLPGVAGAGGLQALAKGGLPLAGKRVVVAGSGPLLLAVADALGRMGAQVPMVLEQADAGQVRRFATGLWRHPGKLLQGLGFLGLAGRYHPRSWVIRAEGAGRLERVVVSRGGRTETVACDLLACGFGLIPNLELAAVFGCATVSGRVAVDAWQRSSDPTVLCAGEVVGIGGVEAALVEGRIAGLVAAGAIAEAGRLQPERDALRRLAARLESCFALRPELARLAGPHELLCRCEDVTVGTVAGCGSWREARLRTRCGMGTCQGRTCGGAAAVLFGWQTAPNRPPVQPVPLASLLLPQPRT